MFFARIHLSIYGSTLPTIWHCAEGSGQVRAGEETHRQELAICQTVLGKEHADTLTRMTGVEAARRESFLGDAVWFTALSSLLLLFVLRCGIVIVSSKPAFVAGFCYCCLDIERRSSTAS